MPTALTACLLDGGHDGFVDGPRENHFNHVHGRLVGYTQAFTEFCLYLELVEHLVDLRSAAVHDDGVQAADLEHDHVAGKALRKGRVHHGVAAELHDDDLIVIALQEGQSLRQDAGGKLDLAFGFAHGGILRFWNLSRLIGHRPGLPRMKFVSR